MVSLYAVLTGSPVWGSPTSLSTAFGGWLVDCTIGVLLIGWLYDSLRRAKLTLLKRCGCGKII